MTQRMVAAATAAGLLLSACASAPSAPVLPPPPLKAPLNASYDWHVLLLAPFGSLLKDVHLPLHEVLLFRDEDESRSAADDAECFASDGALPRFVDQALDQYLLCFRHDRLSRIAAAVRLPASRAATDFADACGLWLKNADVAAAAAAQATVGAAPAAVATSGTTCAGNDADIGFSAGLEADPDGADALLSIKLEASHR
ncbi:MAG: hypothetical protein ACLPWG_19870 [Steroidobacteraceae bacterium]